MAKRETFGDRLKALRTEKGVSAYRLAQLIGITRQSLSQMEHESITPNWDTIQRLAKALDVSLEAFSLPVQLPDPPPVKTGGRPPKKRRKPRGPAATPTPSASDVPGQ